MNECGKIDPRKKTTFKKTTFKKPNLIKVKY